MHLEQTRDGRSKSFTAHCSRKLRLVLRRLKTAGSLGEERDLPGAALRAQLPAPSLVDSGDAGLAPGPVDAAHAAAHVALRPGLLTGTTTCTKKSLCNTATDSQTIA